MEFFFLPWTFFTKGNNSIIPSLIECFFIQSFQFARVFPEHGYQKYFKENFVPLNLIIYTIHFDKKPKLETRLFIYIFFFLEILSQVILIIIVLEISFETKIIHI